MPVNPSHWTDSRPCCELIDLLKETGGMEEGKVRPTHDQRGIGTDTRSYLIRYVSLTSLQGGRVGLVFLIPIFLFYNEQLSKGSSLYSHLKFSLAPLLRG